MSFFVRPLKYVNFHPEYYPSCLFNYLLATMKYTWCAYLSPPFIGILRHKSLIYRFSQA